MKACTFFGHRDSPDTIKPQLKAAVLDLIIHHGITMFYMGNQGNFDAMARSVLREIKLHNPHTNYAVVLYRMPGKPTEYDDYSDTMLPEGVETVHPRFAISWRNEWLLQHSDYVITYITHSWGGAARYANKARHQGKTVLSLSDSQK